MLTFLDPWHDKSNTGYQVTQSLIALGSGGWTGVGSGYPSAIGTMSPTNAGAVYIAPNMTML